jgi:hypothetical protein
MEALGLSPEAIATAKTVGVWGRSRPPAREEWIRDVGRAGHWPQAGGAAGPPQRGAAPGGARAPRAARRRYRLLALPWRRPGAPFGRPGRAPRAGPRRPRRTRPSPRAAALAWSSLELVSYVLIRPLFLRLLERNPAIAGDPKRKAETATQMLPRVVCFVHNLLQVRGRLWGEAPAGALRAHSPGSGAVARRDPLAPPLATPHQVPLGLLILTNPDFYAGKSRIFATNDFSTLVMAISAGAGARRRPRRQPRPLQPAWRTALRLPDSLHLAPRTSPSIHSTPSPYPLTPAPRPGYFAYDTLECILRYEHEGPEFLMHGVFCFIVFASLVHIRCLHWFGCAAWRGRGARGGASVSGRG